MNHTQIAVRRQSDIVETGSQHLSFRAESESYRRRVKISPKAAVIGYAGQVTVAVILATLFIWASNQDYEDQVAMSASQKQIIAAHVSVSRGHMVDQ